jgi:hypothetical protein
MTPATNHRQASSAIITALQTNIAAVTLADGVTKAFDRVELFDSENLPAAFQYLLISQQRVCVIVALDEKFPLVTRGMKLILQRELPVALLISNRVLGDRTASLFGNATTPGAFGLMELVLTAVTGQLLPNPCGVVCEPSSSGVITVSDPTKKLPNRTTVSLLMNCRGGWLEADTQQVL